MKRPILKASCSSKVVLTPPTEVTYWGSLGWLRLSPDETDRRGAHEDLHRGKAYRKED
ncbi:MAG: hypothetical protein JO070_01695 [Verrucomicrobia bacterium]|nr:hypothetical protein [Verrucomicrobiota bacterium]